MGISPFNENSRVKIPSLLTLSTLGYGYIGSKDHKNIHSQTNIYLPSFEAALLRLNPELEASHIHKLIEHISLILSYDDKGLAFFQALIFGLSNHKIEGLHALKLIDWQIIENNIFEVTTELSYGRDIRRDVNNGGFRPDITLFVNGLPLSFIEVKKPDNKRGVQAELSRLKSRFENKHYKAYFNLTQIIICSNNLPYDESEIVPLSGAFYTTSYSLKLNHFREEDETYKGKIQTFSKPARESLERILKDTNSQAIYNTKEFESNLAGSTPTNSLLISLFSKERFMFLLAYGIAFVKNNTKSPEGHIANKLQRHIMRYPQFFATLKIRSKLQSWIDVEQKARQKEMLEGFKNECEISYKRGIIWHTQGSGKTALSFYALRMIKDFYTKEAIPTRFYFIVDRLDLLEQACREFAKRGLHTKAIDSKQSFINELSCMQSNTEGKDEMIVVNIQKFSQDSKEIPNPYIAKIQRVFFIDEAHRSYADGGSNFTYLFNADKNAIFLALSGTPLLEKGKKKKSTDIFGPYIHKYFYNQSIQDGYTLRLIKEDIQSSYKEKLHIVLKNLSVQKGALKAKQIYAHTSFITPLFEYIALDFQTSRLKLNPSIGAMVVCASSEQARALYTHSLQYLQEATSHLPPPCLIRPQLGIQLYGDIHRNIQRAYHKARYKRIFYKTSKRRHSIA